MRALNNLFLLLLFVTINYTSTIYAEEAAEANDSPVNVLPAQSLPPAAVAVSGGVNSPSTPTTPVEKEIPEYLKYCFHTETNKLCLQVNNTQNESNNQNGANNFFNADPNSCQCKPHPTIANSWYCCNITTINQISTCSNISNWSNLHVHNATITSLDLSTSIFQTLHSLAITGGNITELKGSFSRVSSIKCLNISNNNLSDISQRALKGAPHLKFLDISKNNLTRIPMLNQNQNITVNMRGNKHMLCSDLVNTIFRDSIKFLQPDASYCLMNYTYNWFNSTDYVSIRELEMAGRFQTECPVIPGYGNCTCSREQMLIVGDQYKPSAKLFCRVDCSNLGLIELPPKLPENTFSLNISNNNITSIGKQFHTNPTYWNIVKLYADNNQISSMYELEGTKFLDQFQRLYLRNNELSKLPVYLLTNVLTDSDVGRNIYLAGNKLQCDCNSAKVLKHWLLERSRDIPDYADILCRNMPQSVVELQEMKVCHQSPHDWTDYIYYLIAAEVLLLLALITKVSYDYWVFKTAGYLPWPASKMPKLPCDWLCE